MASRCAGGDWRRSCRSLAGPIAGRSGRTPLTLVASVCCSVLSRASSVALYRAAPEHPSTRAPESPPLLHVAVELLFRHVSKEPRQCMVRGRGHTATPLVRDNMREEQFALLAAALELRCRSLYRKVCWQHCCPCCPSFPLM